MRLLVPFCGLSILVLVLLWPVSPDPDLIFVRFWEAGHWRTNIYTLSEATNASFNCGGCQIARSAP